METNVDLIKNIKKEYNVLSKKQKLIADFIIKNYDKAAFMTASDLGTTVDVSESTVVRFAITLGYSGYKEFRKDLHELVKNKLTTVQRITMTNKYTDNTSALKTVMQKDVENIQATINQIDMMKFQESIELILKAEQIYILGLRSSSYLAGYLGFYLNFLMKNANIIVAGPNDVFEQLLKVNEDDVMIGISYPRYSKRALEAIDFAKKKGCKIISITDSSISPAAKESDISLTADSDMLSFVDSLVAPMSLINALIISIGMEKKDEITANFEDLEQIWKKYDVYDFDSN